MNLQEEIEKRLKNNFTLVLVFSELNMNNQVWVTVLADGITAKRLLPRTRNIEAINQCLDEMAQQVDRAARYIDFQEDLKRSEQAMRNYQRLYPDSVALAETSQ